jgi:hypothetical protein
MTRELGGLMPWQVFGGDPWLSDDEALEYTKAFAEIMDEHKKQAQKNRRK